MGTERLQTGWAAVHGGVFIAALVAVALCQPSLAWPWYLLLPLAVYAGVVLALPLLRRTAPRLTVGRLTGAPLLSAVALSVVTSLVLLAYHTLARPDVTALAAGLPVAAFGSLALAGLCFSVTNATLEELIFRGVLYEAVVAERGAAVAVGVTAVLFGLGHMRGYPPGLPGAVLAGGYGVALGLLRWWTGGLGLAVAAHVCADATIFGLLVWAGAFGS
jgi:membrane protease YdiL (CAAX protease family)